MSHSNPAWRLRDHALGVDQERELRVRVALRRRSPSRSTAPRTRPTRGRAGLPAPRRSAAAPPSSVPRPGRSTALLAARGEHARARRRAPSSAGTCVAWTGCSALHRTGPCLPPPRMPCASWPSRADARNPGRRGARSSDVPAGVDRDVVAGDVPRSVGDEEVDRVGDVLLLHEPAERGLRGEVRVDLLGASCRARSAFVATIVSIRAPCVTFGQTSLTVMSCGPSSRARVRVRPRTAHFEEE